MGVPVAPKFENAAKVVLVTDNLEKSDVDDCTYRIIRLANELEVLIAHDPKADKASASLDVNVGNFSDEKDMPGMAHAVEHLLFMGTEKYPAENHYHQFLSSNSGSSNAYTADTSTNYYFDIAAKPSNDKEPTEENPSPFHEALDIFAQFFIAPLFLEDTLDRELRAVDSENKKNLQSDIWRLHQLGKTLSNPNHPYCHFSTGNFEQLKTLPEACGINVRDKFMEFHAKHYSANLMRLVVLGREPVYVLQKWVVEIFSAIPNKNLKPNRWPGELPLRKSELGKIIYAKPVFDKKELCLTFPVMDEYDLWDCRPTNYVSHLIGHEGPGSLMSYLKSKGWVNYLSVGVSPICPGAPGLLECEMRLTDDGTTHYKDIVKAFFHYVSLLKETPPQKWMFEEQQLLAALRFQFCQKTNVSRFTSKTSAIMQLPYPRDRIFSHNKHLVFRPDLITELVESINPDNMRMLITHKEFPGNWDQREKWYGTEHRVDLMDEEFVQDLREALKSTSESRPKDLFLPGQNRFVPTNVEVNMVKAKEPKVTPLLIRNDPLCRTWWKKDDTFGVPKASVVIQVKNPYPFSTSQTNIQGKLLTELVRDALEEHAYDAELAGMEYTFFTDRSGYWITVTGYNDKLNVLLNEVLVKLRNVEFTDQRFEIIRERVSRNYRNFSLQSAYYQIGMITLSVTSEVNYPREIMLEECAAATADEVRSFHKLLLAKGFYEIMIHGNLHKEEALNITNMIETTLKCRVISPREIPSVRHVVMPSGSNLVYSATLEDEANINNCTEYWFYLGFNEDERMRAVPQLFDQMASEPAFNQLRTKEQLGYVVFTGCRTNGSMLSYRVLVQSEKYPQYLHFRIQSWLANLRQTIVDMSDIDFESHKRSLIVSLTKKPEDLGSEAARINTAIQSGYYRFSQHLRDSEIVKTLTKDDVLAFYDRFISDASPQRTKLTVQMFARGEKEIEALVSKTLTHLQDRPREAQSAVRAHIVEAVLRVSSDGLATKLRKDLGLNKELAGKIVEEIGADIVSVGKAREQDETKKMEYGLPESIYGSDVKYITDLATWKKALPISPAPVPCKDLREFEEFGSKL